MENAIKHDRDERSEERSYVHFGRYGIPNLDYLGRLRYAAAREPLRDHRHAGAFKICYLERGTQTYVVDGTEYELVGGDLFVTLPGETHSSGSHPEEKSVLYWMTVAESVGASGFLGLGPDGDRLLADLRGLGRRRFRANPGIREHLDAIFAIERRGGYLTAERIVHHVVEFLISTLESARTVGHSGIVDERSPAIGRAVSHVGANLEAPVSLQELADAAGLSLSHFKRRFRREIGVPPRQFVLQSKIEEAQHVLSDPRASVTETAFRLGFSSSQYFATVYRRFTGRSPSEDRPAPGRPGGVDTSSSASSRSRSRAPSSLE